MGLMAQFMGDGFCGFFFVSDCYKGNFRGRLLLHRGAILVFHKDDLLLIFEVENWRMDIFENRKE